MSRLDELWPRFPMERTVVIAVDGTKGKKWKIHLRSLNPLSALCGLIVVDGADLSGDPDGGWSDEDGTACEDCLRVFTKFDRTTAQTWWGIR